MAAVVRQAAEPPWRASQPRKASYTLSDLLLPGGYILVYNVAVEPTPAANALSRNLWEGVGFEIHAFDQDDRGAAIGIGKELGWEMFSLLA